VGWVTFNEQQSDKVAVQKITFKNKLNAQKNSLASGSPKP
jgi:hypothetical protein